MKIDRTTLIAFLLVFAAGWWFAARAEPPQPQPSPLANRPGVRWVIRAAKALLWGLAFAEERPAVAVQQEAVRLVKSPDRQGEDRRIDWSEGW